MTSQRVGEEFGPSNVRDHTVEQTTRDELQKPKIRTLDEAIDAAIRAGVRVDPRRERVTPEALGLSKEEAAEYGRPYVLALLSREVGRAHDDPVDTEYWRHAPMAIDIAPGMVQIACSCDWEGTPAGKYQAFEQHARHRHAHMEVANARNPRRDETDRSTARRFVPQGARGVRGAGEVQHAPGEAIPENGVGERLLEWGVGQNGDVAPGVLRERGVPVRPRPGSEGPRGAGQDTRGVPYRDSVQQASPAPAAPDAGSIEFQPIPFTGQGMGT